jgi:glycosyltransferase involved in cell wall biosynthesis
MSADLSVIMPLYNCEQWVEQAVRSLIDNADGLLELIVVDDGSTDNSVEIVRSIEGPVKLIQQQNAGPAAARNAGLKAARGSLIGFLDADDIWVAGAPDPRRVLLENGADYAIGRIRMITGDPPQFFGDAHHAVLLGSALFKAELVERVGPFDVSRLHGEDVDWLMRICELGVAAERCEDHVMTYRLFREGSLTSDRETNRGAITSVLHASLARRGLVGGDSK